ncbi:hypothetical protein FS749_016027 [Ceratobasidium sp. UAMH 11750]|nr:hypothetical protein FS749_016027 [Ceratobasidium sp. UAMH 11750]
MSSSNTLLNGKKVLVIGGSSGIGRGVAAAALSNGASVVIASSTQSKVDAAVELLKKGIEGKQDVTVSGQSFDITNFPALTGFLTKEAPFDHLVITAGAPPKGSGPAADVDLREQLQESMDSRYWAVLNAANHIHQHKLVRPGGSITLTIGTAQKRPIAGWGFNLGAAGAVETATRGLAVDLKPLRVNTISPGLVDTEMIQRFPAEMRDHMFKTYREKLLVGHIGTPEEVAEAYIFAMKCQYLTGQIITVDGGGVLV